LNRAQSSSRKTLRLGGSAITVNSQYLFTRPRAVDKQYRDM
jgi:hypothetical protein